MDIFIDYETICMNCQEKGYSFGYGIKTIEYKGVKILDIPQPNLNGACIHFKYEHKPVLLKSSENSHHSESGIKNSKFVMINARSSKNNLISRFTYSFSFPESVSKKERNPRIIEYVDVYRFKTKPYFFIYYAFRNLTGNQIKNFNFYQFYDFDIYGQNSYLSDIARYNSKLGIIYQYDSEKGQNKSLFAGFGSNSDNIPDNYECNSPQNIFIFKDNQFSLRNYAEKGPSDCAIALQWNSSVFEKGELKIYPIIIVTGFGKEKFFENVKEARKNLEIHQNSVLRAIKNVSRQKIDPKLQKLSFSQKTWCK